MTLSAPITTMPIHSLRTQQRGAVLIISLILLLIMTILALSMSQTSRLQERMAGNVRDLNTAVESAETGLRGGEGVLKASGGVPALCSTLGTCTQSGGVLPKDTIDSAGIDLTAQSDAWWTANAMDYGTTGQDLAGVESDPKFIIEEAGSANLGGGMTIGVGARNNFRRYYRVTARAHGKTTVTEVVSDTVYTF